MSFILFVVLGIASAERVSLAPCVTDAKMDIMALIRQAACPASATTGLIVVMFSQVRRFLNSYEITLYSFNLEVFIYSFQILLFSFLEFFVFLK